MTELIILCAFAPFFFLPFPAFKSLTQVWGWTSVTIATICLGYTFFLHYQEPLLWIPAATFLSIFFINLFGQRFRRGISTLAVLFVSQALLTTNLGYIIVLLALSDTFLGAELFLSSQVSEKNRAVQSLYQSAISLLPAAVGFLLRLDGNSLSACVAVTIALRLFSWPVRHWIIEISGENKMFPAYIGIVSSFALWHILIFPRPEIWALVWVSAGILFSIGAKYTEMYAAFSLGVFALNPAWGVLSAALWPLLGHRNYTIYVAALLTCAVGVVLSDTIPKIIIPEASYGLVIVAGLAAGRVFVSIPWTRTAWYLMVLDGFFSLAWAGLVIFFASPSIPEVTPVGISFAVAFLLMFGIGKILFKKKPKFFKVFRGLPPQIFSREIFSAEFMAEKRGETVALGQTRPREWLFEAMESEAYLALLLGGLGVFLIWILR